jgi:hypothetical protein
MAYSAPQAERSKGEPPSVCIRQRSAFSENRKINQQLGVDSFKKSENVEKDVFIPM